MRKSSRLKTNSNLTRSSISDPSNTSYLMDKLFIVSHEAFGYCVCDLLSENFAGRCGRLSNNSHRGTHVTHVTCHMSYLGCAVHLRFGKFLFLIRDLLARAEVLQSVLRPA